jgi:hypothetical protein
MQVGQHSRAGKDSVNKRFTDWCEANGQLDVASAPVGTTIKIRNRSLARSRWDPRLRKAGV